MNIPCLALAFTSVSVVTRCVVIRFTILEFSALKRLTISLRMAEKERSSLSVSANGKTHLNFVDRAT
jgi:hypothetical protein